ncbi:MAG: histidine kinase [Lachnospiraceae bacterium]|nr:histidine kinase [Lachnospiraceae bacterium]MCI9624080.1 histidine kinase [Lachnospiraceae bacterium]
MKRIRRLLFCFAAGTLLLTALEGYLCLVSASQGMMLLVFLAGMLFGCGCMGYFGWFFGGLRRNVRLALESRRQDYIPEAAFAEDINKLKNMVKNFRTSRIEEAEYMETQLQVLMSQINPHFLYNTLESIRGQALFAGDEIVADMAEMLAMFFRYCISQKGTFVALRDEVRNIEVYLKIMKFRLSDKFEFVRMIDDPGVLNYEIPKLTLQPVIENALLHGLKDFTEGGLITLRVIETEEYLKIYIRDNGSGIPYESLQEINRLLQMDDAVSKKDRMTGHGIALYNINERIKLAYGMKFGLRVFSTEDVGTNVLVSIPKKEFEEQK